MQRRSFIGTGFALIAVLAIGQPSTSHAQFDPYAMLGKTLGLTSDQVQGGLGSVLTLGIAVAAVPVNDTLKEGSRHEPTRVLRTHPRARLWRAQTPQGFPRAILEQAHQRAVRLGRCATDDAALVEALGLSVRLVPDSIRNLKITTAEDLALAELIAGA